MQRITFYERQQIELYLRMKKKKTWIAERLNRDYSVIKREIKRNSGKVLPYTAKVAQEIADRKARNTNKRKLEKHKNQKLKEFVEESLEKQWSPDQIAGRLKGGLVRDVSETVSHETIYDYIYNGEGRLAGLYKNLRTTRKRRQKKFSRKKHGNIIKNRVSIHKRSRVVDERKEYGHWETDSVIFSKQKNVLSVQYERKSQLCRLHKIFDKSAEEGEFAVAKTFSDLPVFFRKTVTRDNGTENVRHLETYDNLNVKSYFCDPYCSWQKGGVENLNKLARQYLPRDIDFAKIGHIDIIRYKNV